jgi:hypothetical protein
MKRLHMIRLLRCASCAALKDLFLVPRDSFTGPESLSFKDAPARESFKARRASKGVFQSPTRKQGSISKPDAQGSLSKPDAPARESFKARRASKGVFQSPTRKQGSISEPDAQAREYFKARRASKGLFASQEKATLAGASGFEDPTLRDSLAGASGFVSPFRIASEPNDRPK